VLNKYLRHFAACPWTTLDQAKLENVQNKYLVHDILPGVLVTGHILW
jgi:hypothetical protein